MMTRKMSENVWLLGHYMNNDSFIKLNKSFIMIAN